jgi:hypothetical protein
LGQWCEDNGLGKDVLNDHDRAAAIAMAEEPEALRECLEATKRRSLQHIHKNDFPQFAHASKKKKLKRKKSDFVSQQEKMRAIIRPLIEAGEPINRKALAAEHGVTNGVIENAALMERGFLQGFLQGLQQGRDEVDPLAPSAMKGTMMQRYEAALQVARKQIREELIEEVRAEVHADFEKVYLEHWRQRCARAERITAAHKGVLSKQDYRILLAGLHPDQNRFERARDAFEIFKGLEDVLVKEKEPVSNAPPLPSTVAELLARRKRR